MTTKETNTGAQWLLFFASTAALLAAIFFKFEYLTLIIPFVCTSFVKAMRII